MDESVLDELSRVSASISAVPVIPHRDAFHHIIISIVSNTLESAMRKPRSASPSVVVVGLRCRGCSSALRALAAAQARNSESAGAQRYMVAFMLTGRCGLAWTSALSGAQPHMTWNTRTQPFDGNSYFAFELISFWGFI